MPATSGRVRMPHNNRVSSSSALKMTGIWKDTIGYDPYAGDGDDRAAAVDEEERAVASEQAQGLMALARLSNQGVTDSRGACKKCGMVGHLTFQCRNHLQSVAKVPAATSTSASKEGIDVTDSSSDDVSVSDVSVSSDDSDSSSSVEHRRKKRRSSHKRQRTSQSSSPHYRSSDEDSCSPTSCHLRKTREGYDGESLSRKKHKKQKGIKVDERPSEKEVVEHELAHIPFRSWCPHCVRGRAVSAGHGIKGKRNRRSQ